MNHGIISLPELCSVSGLADTSVIRESPATSCNLFENRSQPLSTKVVLVDGRSTTRSTALHVTDNYACGQQISLDRVF